MRRLSLLLPVAVGLLVMPITARAQQTPTFTRPAVAVRVGAMPTMNENADGLAPYVEVKSRANFGKTPFGLALYTGLSREESEVSRRSFCITGPCLGGFRGRRTYLDLATGLRIGVFPRHGPVDAFIGFAPHLLRRATESKRVDEERWFHYSTVEAGASVQGPITSRLSIGAGVRGEFLVHANGENLLYGDALLELGRYVVHLGVQYTL